MSDNTLRPTIAIGDIHGLPYWLDIVNAHPDAHIIFLGDYLDPFSPMPRRQILANLIDIINLKRQRPDTVTLLLGNHDLHYFDSLAPRASRFDEKISETAALIFGKHRHLFQYAHQDGNRLFTHAGISHRWFISRFCGNPDAPIAAQLNAPAPHQRAALYTVGAIRGGHDDTDGGIFWADKSELTDPLHGYTQIVGHNSVPLIIEQQGNHDNKIIFCDCLKEGLYLYLDCQ